MMFLLSTKTILFRTREMHVERNACTRSQCNMPFSLWSRSKSFTSHGQLFQYSERICSAVHAGSSRWGQEQKEKPCMCHSQEHQPQTEGQKDVSTCCGENLVVSAIAKSLFLQVFPADRCKARGTRCSLFDCSKCCCPLPGGECSSSAG